MTNENKIEIKETNTCFCKSEWFKKFLTNTLAVFVGVFCALSLFSALHRPKMPPCPYKIMKRPPMAYHHHQFKRFEHGPRADFHYKRIEKRNFDKDAQRPVPVRVNVQTEK